MKWAPYNFFFHREGKHFIYNSLSNSFALLDGETYNALKKSCDSGTEISVDNELLDSLRIMKAVDTDVDTELLRIRHLEQTRKFNPTTIGLTINPTLACNFRCSYCFEKEHPSIFMSDEIEDSIVEMVKGNSIAKRISVTWFGGEPLLAFNRIVSITNRLMATGKEYSAGMISNGYLLSKDIARKLSDLKIRHIQVTLDGDRETHNSRRMLADRSGTFDKIVEMTPNFRG